MYLQTQSQVVIAFSALCQVKWGVVEKCQCLIELELALKCHLYFGQIHLSFNVQCVSMKFAVIALRRI